MFGYDSSITAKLYILNAFIAIQQIEKLELMNWILNFFTSSIGKKILMSLTGLFLTLFLVIHLIGNLQLLAGDGQAFNEYAHFMGHNPLIQTISIGNFFFILLHFFLAIGLTQQNKKSRQVAYANDNKSGHWTSRNMLVFGAIIFLFIIIHLSNFWYRAKFGSLPMVDYGNGPVKDLYNLVDAKFSNGFYVLFYVGSMLFIAFHLWHGFQSAFQTVGVNSSKYTPIIKGVGYGLSLLLCVGFAIIPLVMYIT